MVIGDLGERNGCFLRGTAPGSTHDKTLAERTAYWVPADSELHQDTGFQAFAPAAVVIFRPIKQQPGGERSEAEREHHRVVSHIRVTVEHLWAGVKRVRIVKDWFRTTKPTVADRGMRIACGLHNLRQAVRHPAPLSATG